MPTHVTIFLPAFGRQVQLTTVESLVALTSGMMHRGIDFTFCGFSWPDIDEARNCALTWWYDVNETSSHLLMVDADMGFKPEMVLDMITFGEPVVGALYPKKTLPIEWVASGCDAPEIRKGFIEVEGVGGGCLLIRRDAVPPLIEKFPELIYEYVSVPETKFGGATRTLGFFDSMRSPKGKVSEDISFCRRVREAGGKVWGSIGHDVQHIGLWSFHGNFTQWRVETAKAKHAEHERLKFEYLSKLTPEERAALPGAMTDADHAEAAAMKAADPNFVTREDDEAFLVRYRKQMNGAAPPQ